MIHVNGIRFISLKKDTFAPINSTHIRHFGSLHIYVVIIFNKFKFLCFPFFSLFFGVDAALFHLHYCDKQWICFCTAYDIVVVTTIQSFSNRWWFRTERIPLRTQIIGNNFDESSDSCIIVLCYTKWFIYVHDGLFSGMNVSHRFRYVTEFGAVNSDCCQKFVANTLER